MNNINLNKMRKEILEESKKYIIKEGWNNNLFDSVYKNKKFKNEEIKVLFPNGYLSLLIFYLDELNKEMVIKAKNLNLIKMQTHTKIKEIILLKLRNNQDEKDLIKRTYFSLLLPKHSKIALISLYKTIDQIWYIAGDNSTDFNFYTKRAILAAIYTSTVLYWINNHDFNKTINFLDNKLKKVSKIPQIKTQAKNIFSFLPNNLKIIKKFSSFMQ